MVLSVASKAIMGMLATIAGTIAATFPDTGFGKVAVVVAAALAALVAVYYTKNTETVTPGGVVAGVGAVVEGTTGVVGGVIDGTIGKLIPKGKHRDGGVA